VAAHRNPRNAALDQLPLPYATALRMRDGGIADEVIAECIGVERDAIETLMRLAEAKLAATGFGE
jgi:DNA-directed RNA polymerase specialized sigma24 family protein